MPLTDSQKAQIESLKDDNFYKNQSISELRYQIGKIEEEISENEGKIREIEASEFSEEEL